MRRKKWKQQARILQYLFYVGVRIGVCFFQVMSNSAARALADLVGWIVFTFDHKHRRMALDNLRQAFPGRYSEKQLHAMVLATYRHFFTLFGEIIQMPRKVHRHNADYHLDLGPRKEEVLKLLHSDRPLLIVTGHFGNWELAGVWLGALGFRTYAVARPLDNVYLNAYFQSIREHLGQTILPKRDLPLIQRTLAQGGKVAVLADQYAGPRGQMVDFFGRQASAYRGISILALQHNAPLLVVGVRKVAEPMRYQAVITDIIDPEEYTGSPSENVRQITQRYSTGLENVIRSAPEQYFWIHNRWKPHRQPKSDMARAA